MRPPAESQSALRNPLNHVLGTEANVRIVRALGAVDMPVGKGELATMVKLSPSGVRRALQNLIELGIVEEVGRAHAPPVRIRQEHALSGALRELFREERARFDRLVQAVRDTVSQIDPPPRSAWIEGPVARSTDEPGDPVVVGVLVSARDAASARTQFLSALPQFVRDPDVQIVPRIWTGADLDAAIDLEEELSGAILLVAPHPLQLLDNRHATSRERSKVFHAQQDRRALALARVIASRLTDDPDLVRRALSYVRQRMKLAPDREQDELGEWLDLLENKSFNQVRRVLLDPGERSTRLRQSLPFLDVLTETERNEILERLNDET